MPPKQTFTKDKIVDAALNLMRREGIQKLTARAIAKELGSSTMPVYSTIESMEKLKELIFQRSLEVAASFRAKYQADDVLTKYAVGHIMLAKEEKMLFRLVWMDDSWDRSVIHELLSGSIEKIRAELKAEGKYQFGDTEQEFKNFISKAWIIMRGIAVDINLGSSMIVDPDQDNFAASITEIVRTILDELLQSHLK